MRPVFRRTSNEQAAASYFGHFRIRASPGGSAFKLAYNQPAPGISRVHVAGEIRTTTQLSVKIIGKPGVSEQTSWLVADRLRDKSDKQR